MVVTIRDVAREARVSVASVSRALNGHAHVTEQTRARILSIAQRLRYVPHGAARSLIMRRTHTIGALVPDLHGEFYSELLCGIDRAARARGLHLLVSSSLGGRDEAAAVLRAMAGRVDGMVILSAHVDEDFLHANLAATTPAVLLNSAASRDYPVIAIDNLGGTRAMVRHLVGLGNRDIAMIAGPAENFDAQQREQGFRDEMAASAGRTSPLVVRGDFTEETGYAEGAELARRKQRPQAIFAANDMMAVGCLRALNDAGLRVPQDIALVGFDDIPLARYLTPPLTTVRQRIIDLGRLALEQLVSCIEKPAAPVPTHMLDCEVIVRASCGALQHKKQPSTNNRQNAGGV